MNFFKGYAVAVNISVVIWLLICWLVGCFSQQDEPLQPIMAPVTVTLPETVVRVVPGCQYFPDPLKRPEVQGAALPGEVWVIGYVTRTGKIRVREDVLTHEYLLHGLQFADQRFENPDLKPRR